MDINLSGIFPKNHQKEIHNSPFNNLHYQKHNIARLNHLDKLGFDFNQKTVLEFGAGTGDHTYYLLIKGAKVFATDGRPELIDTIKSRFPVEVANIDAEKETHRLSLLQKFDIIYCYGFLYHLSNPEEFLDAIKGISDLLLLETCVSGDQMEDGIYLVNENSKNLTQALSGKGCRPTRNWIFKKLKQNYNFVYIPKSQPEHPEFPKDWNISYYNSDYNLIRAIFIASNYRIENEKLQDYLPKSYM